LNKVKSIKPEQTYDWLINKHYAKRIPSISWAFGFFRDGILSGVCTFGTPASSTLLRGVCGDKWSESVIELNRLVINNANKNDASFFISKSISMLPKPKIIVSYADTDMNHIGTVYQACNFIYTGLSSKFKDPKIRGLEHQHHATYANGMSNDDLKRKYGDRLYFEERSRKHRYIYFHGSKSGKKRMISDLKYKCYEYPKGKSERYSAKYQPPVQMELL
jgi:hypothetical protein